MSEREAVGAYAADMMVQLAKLLDGADHPLSKATAALAAKFVRPASNIDDERIDPPL